MLHQKDDTTPQQAIRSLDDLIVTYDMKHLLAEARTEFESIISSRELLGQKAIGSYFNLELKDDERN